MTSTMTIARRSQPASSRMVSVAYCATAQVTASATIAPMASCPSSTSRPYVLSQTPRKKLDIARLHACALGDDGAEHLDRHPARQEDEAEDDRDRGGVARPLRTDALAEPEDAEGREHRADDELQQVLRDGSERMAKRRAGGDDEDTGRGRAPDRRAHRVDPFRAERDDDER